MTVSVWMGITKQIIVVSIIMVLLIILCIFSLMLLLQYTENPDIKKLQLVPCSIMMLLALSFTSFWSCLMVGCSNEKKFTMTPFFFATIQLGFTCVWCNIYWNVSGHVANWMNLYGGSVNEPMMRQDDDYQPAYR